MHTFSPKYTVFYSSANDRLIMFQAVTVTAHVDDFVPVIQPVEDGCGDCGVTKKVHPFIEAFVGCDDQ